MATVLIMAGGTGGHVFPGLAIAQALQAEGLQVAWLGTAQGLEARLVPQAQIPLHTITIKGLRGKGIKSWVLAPVKLLLAVYQAAQIIRRLNPVLVIGMGGFASGPGGLAAKLLCKPLLIHEQNAIAGVTNRLLARLANRTLAAFPDAFAAARRAIITGNPLRAAITALPPPDERWVARTGALRILILGGSLGAQALNETVPFALQLLAAEVEIVVQHQTGKDRAAAVQAVYQQHAMHADVVEFIEAMASAYAWADLVICRAGALTVAELAAAGVGSVLIPYPHAVDDHQTHNANYLVTAGAALLLPQTQLTPDHLAAILRPILNRQQLLTMAQAARQRAILDATQRVQQNCLAVCAHHR